MIMDKDDRTGRSETRPRQRGGIVPAPPGSLHQGESSDGLATGLTASPMAELTIACKKRIRMKGEERLEGRMSPLRLYGGGDPEEKKKESTQEETTEKLTQEEIEWREMVFGSTFKEFSPPTKED